MNVQVPAARQAAIATAPREDDVRQAVAAFLRVDAATLDPQVALTAYGLDSLAALELVAALEDAFSCRLPEWLLTECPDIARIAAVLEGTGLAETPAQARARLLADTVLPADVVPHASRRIGSSTRSAFVTGGTGFLGAWLIRTLLDEGREVVCLVRPRPGQTADDRLATALRRYGVWREEDCDRLTTVAGDVAEPHLGLAPHVWAALAAKVGDLYHAAAAVNWVAAYDALRASNVLGTTEVLRLACAVDGGTFHFVSSLSVLFASDGPPLVCEADTMLPHVERLPLGYAQTKCVAEALVREAARRGLPSRIYRPALLAGDSVGGVSNLDDLTAALMKGCIRMGAAPDLDWVFDAVPVDVAARAIVRLGATAGEQIQTFHVRHDRPRHWRECVLWMNLFGYDVRLEAYDRWLARLQRQAASADHPLTRLVGFFARGHRGASTAELYEERVRSRVDDRRARAAARQAGITYPPLDAPRLESYVDNYVARGFLPRPSRTARVRRAGGHLAYADDAGPVDRDVLVELLRRHFDEPALDLANIEVTSRGSDHSIISELSSWKRGGRAGFFGYRLELTGPQGPRTLALVAKIKPPDEDVLEVAETVARVCDERIACAMGPVRERLGIRGSQKREPAVYGLQERDPQLRTHMPRCYGTWTDARTGVTGMLLERLTDVVLIDSAASVAGWTPTRLHAAVDGLAQVHAAGARLAPEVAAAPWIGHVHDTSSAKTLSEFWEALAAHATPMFEEWAGPSLVQTHARLARSVADWWPVLDASPRTLIHHDCNSRNVALRRSDDGPIFVMYDWELATVGAPQRDLAELLCFVLPPHVDARTIDALVERHRLRFERASGTALPARAWRDGFCSALADLLVSRLAFYALIHRVRSQPFLPRVVATWGRLAAWGSLV